MLKFIKEKILLNEAVCPWWLAYAFDNPVRKFFHDPTKLFRNYLKNGMTVLDIGCGMGYFSIAMAKLIGDKGKVIAVDIQEKMLQIMRNRAEKAGMLNRIIPSLAKDNKFGVNKKADFVLTFWVVHEVPDKKSFFTQIYNSLKPEGRYLIAEPNMHTSKKYFDELEKLCVSKGFKVKERPKVSLSRALLLVKK